jgi:LemA protein
LETFKSWNYNIIMLTLLIIVAAALGLAILILLLLFYNRLVRLRNRAIAAWAGVETELKRRYDLIPVLASTVKGYAAHESSAYESAAKARSRGMDARTVGEHAGATESATLAFSTLFAVAEDYPGLKASMDFRELQQELSHTETVIANARKYYNASVMHYDNARQGFPGNLVAGIFKRSFPDLEYLEFSGEIAAAPPADQD